MKSLFLFIGIITTFYSSAFGQIDYAEVAFQTTKDGIHLDRNGPFDVSRFRNKVRAFPDRLDYRFEYLNELSLGTDWNKFTLEVINMIEYSYKFDHQWRWNPDHDDIPTEGEAFLLSTVQDYVFMLYVTGAPTQYDHLRSICDVVLEYNPRHIDFMTYPAMTYHAVKDYEAAQSYLLQAEVMHPNNAHVALLIAENYEKRGMVNAALVYYQKAMRFGGEDDIVEARTQIDRLSIK